MRETARVAFRRSKQAHSPTRSKNVPNEGSFLMRQLQLVAHGKPSDVIELNTVSEPALGQ